MKKADFNFLVRLEHSVIHSYMEENYSNVDCHGPAYEKAYCDAIKKCDSMIDSFDRGFMTFDECVYQISHFDEFVIWTAKTKGA